MKHDQNNDALHLSLLSNKVAVTRHDNDFVNYAQAYYKSQGMNKLI